MTLSRVSSCGSGRRRTRRGGIYTGELQGPRMMWNAQSASARSPVCPAGHPPPDLKRRGNERRSRAQFVLLLAGSQEWRTSCAVDLPSSAARWRAFLFPSVICPSIRGRFLRARGEFILFSLAARSLDIVHRLCRLPRAPKRVGSAARTTAPASFDEEGEAVCSIIAQRGGASGVA